MRLLELSEHFGIIKKGHVFVRSVPNLFKKWPHKEAERWYSLYLSHLSTSHRDRRLLEACKQIRRYVARDHKPERAYFTYSFEIEALCRLGNFLGAWRQLRRWERSADGKVLASNAKAWTSAELNWFFSYHPQILYLLGKYQPARRMLEALFTKLLKRRRQGMSYEMLWRVYKPVVRPRLPREVTLYHVYRKLGKTLLEWPQWEQFVSGIDLELFRLTGVQQHDLQRDPSLLRPFCEAISRERKARLTSNITTGERELLDSPEDVQRFQDDVARKIASQALVIAQSEQQLKELFPELQSLR